jgi:hypothetical protein
MVGYKTLLRAMEGHGIPMRAIEYHRSLRRYEGPLTTIEGHETQVVK